MNMASEEQKLHAKMQVYNTALFGMIAGLWDLFGESAFATAHTVGDKILETLEKEGVLKITASTPEAIVKQVSQVLVEEIGFVEDAQPNVASDGTVAIACKRCALTEVTAKLEAQGIQPFSCVPMLIATAALRKYAGIQSYVRGRTFAPEHEVCTIEFKMKNA